MSPAMIYRFAHYELDVDRVELRRAGVRLSVEPQVFAMLRLLIENRDRVVTKDEIVEKVWNGRFVSDSAVSSRVKSARQAIGDDGRAQTLIRTVHGIGFSFVADVAEIGPPSASVSSAECELDVGDTVKHARPSIAVIPFSLVGATQPAFPIAEALPHDLITELSRLHWLFVIARGSSFRFKSKDLSLDDVRQRINVRYCLTGNVEVSGTMMVVSVELSDTHDQCVVWSERYRVDIGAVHEVRDQIVNAITTAVEVRIQHNEAQRALKAPENLDAWASYHLGLRHMYRFNKADNDVATGFFARAAALEPGFARAYAGLSFTHFQKAFLRYENGPQAAEFAQGYALQCLERDPLDPFGHLTLGRAQWLRGDLEASLHWLERANTLNPNYAQARYSRGWAEALLGHSQASHANIDAAIAQSPLDPLAYGMLGVRSLTYLGLEDAAHAAAWAERAANSPGAHALIEMIAVAAHSLNGDDARARAWAASVKARAGHLDRTDFHRAFPFSDPATKARITKVLAQFGF
jgi:TolB-like protein/tetratricopeptide (TPR) repeat protein